MSANKIFTLIPKIMSEVGAIGKTRKNTMQNYTFRGIDDFYNALQEPLAKFGVFVAPKVLNQTREDRQSAKGGLLIYTILTVQFTFYADDGSSFDVVTVGEAMDSGDKSANKAMSAAMKYAMTLVFCVPTDEDLDTENHSPVVTQSPNVRGVPSVNNPPQPGGSTIAPARLSTKLVSEAQIKRLFSIMHKTDWKEDDVRHYMASQYKIQSTKELTMLQYDDLMNAIQGGSPK